MGVWSVIQPEATTNVCTCPSFEAGTTGWSAQGVGSTIAQTLGTAKFGSNSLLVTPGGAAGKGAYYAVTVSDALTYTATIWVKGAASVAYQLIIAASGTAKGTTNFTGTGAWQEVTVTGALNTTACTVCVYTAGADVTPFYIDGLLLEQKSYNTTYCDGDQLGCTWTGGAHASSSTRSAQSRAGGRVRDFLADYSVGVTAMEGWGMPEVVTAATDYAILPGGLVQQVRPGVRQWQLVFGAPSPSLTDLHTVRDRLIEAFKPDLVSPQQPVRLRYTGATTVLEIDAWYAGGLEGSIVGDDGLTEQPVARLISDDPWFYQLGNDCSALTETQGVGNADFAVKRDFSASYPGEWTNVHTDLTVNVRAFAQDSQQRVYIGGEFTSASDANAKGIVRLNVDGTLTALTSGLTTPDCHAIAVAADDDVYVGGGFSSAGGVANTLRIARWDTSSSGWAALSTGLPDECLALAIANDGKVVVGGKFNNFQDANGDGITTYNLATSGWASLGAGMNGYVYALAYDHQSTYLYAGGDFDTAGGTAVNGVAVWKGTTWEALGVGTSGGSTAVYGLALGRDGSLYAVGRFNSIGGVAANNVGRWNGTRWEALGSGVSTAAYCVAVDDDGLVYVGGAFESAGGLVTGERVAVWNGSAWAHLDIDLPSTPTIYALGAFGKKLFLGYEQAGTANGGKQTTVTNSGSRTTYPRIKVKRTGGTTCTLAYLKNETTGDTVYLNYSLLDGETLTIDLDYRRDGTKPGSKTAGRKRITSSIFGDVVGRALLAGSDFAAWGLAPGANTVTFYAYEVGTPTVVSSIEWRQAYWGPDGAVS